METLMKVQAIDANLIQSDPVGFGSLLNGGIALRAALIALVFGSILTVLNQSGALFGQLEIQLLPLVLVYMTPFITVTISQVLGIREVILDVMQKKSSAPHKVSIARMRIICFFWLALICPESYVFLVAL